MARGRPAPADIAVPLILLAAAGGFLWLAAGLPQRNIPGSVGLAFVPTLLGALLAFLSALLLLQGLRAPAGASANEAGPGWGQAGLVLGLMAAYILAMTWVGFPLATPPFLAACMWRSGARRPAFIVAMAAVLTGAVWFVFSYLFNVPLPRGPLP